MPSPLDFVRRYRKKPHHVERVMLVQLPVKCVCGSVYYVPENFLTEPLARCPDCNERPRSQRVGAAEEVVIDVKLRFGQLVDQTVVSTRPLTRGEGIVTNPSDITKGRAIIKP